MWECSQALVDMVEISAAYHRSCAAILEELAPLIKAELGWSTDTYIICKS